MKEGFRQSMAWLHTWAGLILGWILFAMFLTGTASYFKPEISHWMQPELPVPTVSHAVAAENAAKYLQTVAPDSARWFIQLPGREDVLRVSWAKPAGGFETRNLDPATGEAVMARETRGGNFFYRFHFELNMPPRTGRWVAGIAAMVMFVTIISGIITHRRFFKDFFTFRPRKAAQRSWLDGHNVLAVLALPYHLIITYTGIITLMFLYLPWGAEVVYGNNRQALSAEVFSIAPTPPPARQPVQLTALGPVIAETNARWPDKPAGLITISAPNDANAMIQMTRFSDEAVAHDRNTLLFNGVTGAFLSDISNDKPVAQVREVLYGLHLGRFGGYDVRGLLFFCGLMGTAMVGTGLVLWTIKRRERAETKSARFGVALVERLNVATILGLPIAMAGFLLSNRLLPPVMDNRADLEVWIGFFGTWIIAALYALWRKPEETWRVLLIVAPVIWAATPLVGWLTTGLYAPGFDAALLVVAVAFLLIWRKVSSRRSAQAAALRPGVAE